MHDGRSDRPNHPTRIDSGAHLDLDGFDRKPIRDHRHCFEQTVRNDEPRPRAGHPSLLLLDVKMEEFHFCLRYRRSTLEDDEQSMFSRLWSLTKIKDDFGQSDQLLAAG